MLVFITNVMKKDNLSGACLDTSSIDCLLEYVFKWLAVASVLWFLIGCEILKLSSDCFLTSL